VHVGVPFSEPARRILKEPFEVTDILSILFGVLSGKHLEIPMHQCSAVLSPVLLPHAMGYLEVLHDPLSFFSIGTYHVASKRICSGPQGYVISCLLTGLVLLKFVKVKLLGPPRVVGRIGDLLKPEVVGALCKGEGSVQVKIF